jgi:hypothetical protein
MDDVSGTDIRQLDGSVELVLELEHFGYSL